MPRKRFIVLLAALTAFGPMSLDLYLPAFPQIAAQFGTDTGSVQLTFSACLLGLGLGQVLWGPTSDRYGRRIPLIIGLVLYIAASLAIVVAPTLGVIVGLRFVQALGGAAGIVLARAAVRDMFSGADLARVMSAIVTVFAIVPVLAPLLGSGFLALGTWHWMFAGQAAFGAACLLGVLFMPETLPADRRSALGFLSAMGQYVTIASNKQWRTAATVAGLGSVALFAYISSSPAVLMDYYGLDHTVFAFTFAGLAACFAIGAQVNMRMLKRFKVRSLLESSVFVQAMASWTVLIMALFIMPMTPFLLPLVIALMTVAGVNSNGMALALDPFPRAAASAAALVGGLQMTLGAIASAGLSAMTMPAPIEMGIVMALAGTISVTIIGIGRLNRVAA